MTAKKPRLRFITYMCPSHPVELYELFMHYIEEEVGCEATLMYESRSSGPLTDRSDPFTDDLVDIGFMSSSSYVKLLDSKNKFAELLPVAAVFDHPKNNKGEKGYFADIIIHVDGRKHVKEFLDLRGCRWAYSDESSLSGNTIVLKTLKELGENASFFGNTLKSGSHLNSVQMVLTKQAEAAAVDANTLAYNKKYLQDGGKDILVLDSLGPLPPYPIVINSRLKDDMKKKLTQAFMKISDNKLWSSQLKKYGLSKFVPNCLEVYEMERDIQSAVKNMHLGPRYY
ncbi:probable phosphite transport system-binding protein PtxB [Anabrus simplex]|uniref:probable phosphite transport system-binding protein PtxB n=1 Tax=Anabrus simplex TaxID=316456 RepID=UPI0035A30CC3